MEERPTHRQVEYIAAIEDVLGEKFRGSTKQEASDYIRRNADAYKEEVRQLNVSTWAIINGYG